ncbi:MAG: hypothetical protein WBW75_12930, partial [Mycobacterium sp.]|uniref:hypothetical protein n=1 Tax=Mycobacterium sp. TaxID=1785 RepID=UPI003C6AA64A
SDVGNPIAACLNAIERGDDAFGPEVQRELGMRQLAELNLSNAARLRAEGNLADALAAHADTILGALADHLEPSAEAMAAAHRLGVTDLTEARTLRGAQLSAWGNAATAVETFAVANQIVGVLLRAMHRPTPDKLRVLAAATPDRLQAARNIIMASDNRTSAAWALTTTGIPVQHVRTLAELDRRDTLGVDGVVEPLDDNDQHSNQRPRATVSN